MDTNNEKYKIIGLGILAVIIGLALFCIFGTDNTASDSNDVNGTIQQLEITNKQAGDAVDDASSKLERVEESIDSGQRDVDRLTESANSRTEQLDECQERLNECQDTIKAERDLYRQIDKANGITEAQTSNKDKTE